MDINFDKAAYAKKYLKTLENKMKKAKKNNEQWQIEELEKEIKHHKELYMEVLK